MNVLFTPFTIGRLEVKNRFVRSATQHRMGHTDGSITAQDIAYYERLAAGGIGLIISASSYVSFPGGRSGARQNALYHDRFIDGYRAVAAAVHKHGAKFVIQLSHAGRQTVPELIGGGRPQAPSSVPNGAAGVMPAELSNGEIEAIIDDFVAAMVRAGKTGCDGIQLHIAHGYLLSQFLSPHTNRRTDRWGGSAENRARILGEILARAKAVMPPEFPILAKLNTTDGFTGPQYLSLEDAVWTAKLLASLGVICIEISGGIQEAKGVMARPGIQSPTEEAYFAAAARAVKQAVSMPLMLVGGLRSMAVMEQIVRGGTAELVALSRPFICEPDLVKKFAAGQTRANCISCNRCFSTESLRCYATSQTP